MAKVRSSFVANSSSSSFIIIDLGTEEYYSRGYNNGDGDYASFSIAELIKDLQEAQSKGVTQVDITYGGFYEG